MRNKALCQAGALLRKCRMPARANPERGIYNEWHGTAATWLEQAMVEGLKAVLAPVPCEVEGSERRMLHINRLIQESETRRTALHLQPPGPPALALRRANRGVQARWSHLSNATR